MSTPTIRASGSIPAYACVKMTSTPGFVSVATAATDTIFGVNGSKEVPNGEPVELQTESLLQVISGGTISAADLLVATTSGAVVVTTSGSGQLVALSGSTSGLTFTAQRVGSIDDSNNVLDIAISGTVANGLNYTFNSGINTITPTGSSGSNANTISGGGNSANPNLILNSASDPTCAYRTISGGYDNVIGSTNTGDGAIASTVSGGAHQRIRRPTDTLDAPNPALSGLNAVPTTASLSLDQPDHGTIGGGSYNAIRNGNYGTISGGENNTLMGENATYNTAQGATIAGGGINLASGNYATIAGGIYNKAQQIWSSICGGYENYIQILDATLFSNNSAVIGGGKQNRIYNGSSATIGGGVSNAIGASGDAANDRGTGSTISGGDTNTIGANGTTARYASVTGGQLNTINAWWGTTLGGYNNLVSPSSFPNGEYSVAMGRDAECQHHMTVCQGGGIFTGAVRGSAQTQTTVLKVSTSNATTTALQVGGGPANAGELAMPSDCLWGFRVMVVGRQTNANTNCAWEITGLATNDSGTAAIVGTPTVTALNTVPSGWGSPTVSVSTTRLVFNVTGHASNTIRWVARAEITQVIS